MLAYAIAMEEVEQPAGQHLKYLWQFLAHRAQGFPLPLPTKPRTYLLYKVKGNLSVDVF